MTSDGTDPGPASSSSGESGAAASQTSVPGDGPKRGPFARALAAVEDHLLAVVLAIMVGVVINGGIRLIGEAADKVVPAMCLD